MNAPQPPRMTKARALELVSVECGKPPEQCGGALGRLLGITRQAVFMWGENVPQEHAYRLRDIRPEWFQKAETE